MSNDRITVTISWEGAATASLLHIFDDDLLVASADDNIYGKSPLTHSYERKHSSIHVIEWLLWFPGKKARNLIAKAIINGAAEVTLNANKEELKNRWNEKGTAP